MSHYEAKLFDHAILQTLEIAKKQVSDALPEINDTEAFQHANRVLAVIVYTDNLIRNADPFLVPEATLNQLNQIASNISNDINGYIQDGHFAHWQRASVRCDNLLVNASQVASALSSGEIAISTKTLVDYAATIKRTVSSIKKETDKALIEISLAHKEANKFDQTLEVHHNTIESQKTRLDNAISQFQAQSADAEDRRRESFDNLAEQIRQRFEGLHGEINNTNGEFVKGQQERLEKALGALNNRISDLKEEANSIVTGLLDDHSGKADEVLSYLTAKRDEASRLVGVIGNIGFTGNFKGVANTNSKSADKWRWIAIFFMGLGIVLVIEFAVRMLDTGFDWKTVLTRIGVVATIFIPAFEVDPIGWTPMRSK